MGQLCECGCGKSVAGDGSRFCRGHNLKPNRTPETRLWAQVKRGEGCWEWTSPTLVDGYGLLRIDGKSKKLAHRFSYELHCGPIPEGMHVLHHCDNRLCVRPDHLFLGTQTDNMRDMVAKGRNADIGGAKNPNARLSPSQVEEIRTLRASGHSRPEVARRFGISTQMVSLITTGKSWASSAA